MIPHDITNTNQAVRRLIERTENPRHRFLLIAYDRHRNLEMAGRYEEIFASDMMVETPVYRLRANEINARLEGKEAVKGLYRMWAQTNQSIFYTENEQVAVADNFVASMTIGYQQMSGRSLLANKLLSYLPGFLSERILKRALAAKSFKADANAMSLRAFEHAASPAFYLNVAGPELLSVRRVCQRFGELTGKKPIFEGKEAGDALLNNGQLGHRLYGYPRVSAGQMIEWIADWVMRGGATLGKPTHFEVRDGKY